MATPAPTVESADLVQRFSFLAFLRRVGDWILGTVWYLHDTVHMRVALPPSATLQVIAAAAQPSVKRLHLRNIFASGRRYYVFSDGRGGFVLTTNAKVSWRYSHRTGIIAIMYGAFAYDNVLTTVSVRSRIKITYLLSMLLLPSWMTALIFFMPWQPIVIVGCIILLYGLAWVGYRANATLEAHEMLFFLEKAFEEHAPKPVPELEAQGAHVIYDYQHDFSSAWEKFYEEVVKDVPEKD